ncbi:MAG: hypothetical protein L7F77_15910 [Candidatus Magnetominusculus sp. LBB02]|nr:hypothetical protein [Candidatus Magnetominusculus sp. LBB02]
MMQRTLWIGLAIMAFLVPLGIVVPQVFGSGGAWGEWDAATLGQMLGFLPDGLRRYAGMWNAPFGDYDIVMVRSRPLSYLAAGVIGGAIVGAAVYILSKFLSKPVARPQEHE